MTPPSKNIDRRALTITAVLMILVGIMLFFIGFSAPVPEEESGMLINFGEVESATGDIEPVQAAPVERTPPPPTPKQITPKTSSAHQEMNTQDFEEAAAIESAKKKKEEERLRKEAQKALEAERELQRQKEIEHQKALEIERKRLEEKRKLENERKAKEAKANAIREQASNAFGKTNNTSTSQGTGKGTGNQGREDGGLSTNGQGLGTSGNWTLAGRSLVGRLPKPKYNSQEEGTVVVEITVDRNGKVTSATPILKGSSTQDATLWRYAKEAALQAKFNSSASASLKQRGTITYKFVLN